MKQLLATILWLFALVGGAWAQTLTGSVSISALGGYQSNPYLDPILNEWESSLPEAFIAVMPTAGLDWSANHLRLGLQTAGRMDAYPGADARSRLQRLMTYGSYELSSRWEVGGQGGWRQYTYGQNTDSWWALPSVEWKPSSDARIRLKVGWTGRTARDSLGNGTTYTSGLGLLTGRVWMTERLRLEGDLYLSDSRATTGDLAFGGSGVSTGFTYWFTNSVSVSLNTGVEYLQYEMSEFPGSETSSSSETDGSVAWEDILWKTGTEIRWSPAQNVTVFGRGRAMQTRQSFEERQQYDGHVSVGAVIRLNRRLVRGANDRSPASRWRQTEEGVRLQLRYTGDGQLYLTGEFNNWAYPGRPLVQIEENRYGAALELSPGQYQYSIRVIDDEKAYWLDLPEGLETVNDGFGGKNGVFVVY